MYVMYLPPHLSATPAQPLTLYDCVSNGLDRQMSLLKDTLPVTKVIVLLMEQAHIFTQR